MNTGGEAQGLKHIDGWMAAAMDRWNRIDALVFRLAFAASNQAPGFDERSCSWPDGKDVYLYYTTAGCTYPRRCCQGRAADKI